MNNRITTPRGEIVTLNTKSGKTVARLTWNPGFGNEMTGAFDNVQRYVDSEVLRRSDPYVPFQTGMLKNSGILGTVLGSGEVRYIAPYGRKQYYSNRGNGTQGTARGGKRGSLWFERMKIDHADSILAGAAKFTKR